MIRHLDDETEQERRNLELQIDDQRREMENQFDVQRRQLEDSFQDEMQQLHHQFEEQRRELDPRHRTDFGDMDEEFQDEFRDLDDLFKDKRRSLDDDIRDKFQELERDANEQRRNLERQFEEQRHQLEEEFDRNEHDFMNIVPPEELKEIESIKDTILSAVSMDEIEFFWSNGDREGLLDLILSRTDLEPEQVKRIMMYAERFEGDQERMSLGPDEKWTELSEKFAKLEEKLTDRELRLAEKEIEITKKLEEQELKLEQREAKIKEKLAQKELKLEQRETALVRADELIQKLEERILALETRVQSLLTKVESGEYFGQTFGGDPVTKSYGLYLNGIAASHTEDVVEDMSGEIFLENLVTRDDATKFKITGGQILIGDTKYDVLFGKARISSHGTSGEKDSMIVIGQIMDADGDTTTMKFSLDSVQSRDADAFQEFQFTSPQSKIAKEWMLSGSGSLDNF